VVIGHNVGTAIEFTDEMMAKWPPDAQAVVRLLAESSYRKNS